MDDGSGSGDMDVPSEPLGDFYWSMRINNFVGGGRGDPRGDCC